MRLCISFLLYFLRGKVETTAKQKFIHALKQTKTNPNNYRNENENENEKKKVKKEKDTSNDVLQFHEKKRCPATKNRQTHEKKAR